MGYQASPDGSFEFPWDEHATGEVEEILNQPWPTMQRFVANSRRVNRWTDFEELTVKWRNCVKNRKERKTRKTKNKGKFIEKNRFRSYLMKIREENIQAYHTNKQVIIPVYRP